MEVDPMLSDADTEEIAAACPHSDREPLHPGPLAPIDRIDRIASSGSGSHLNGDGGAAINGQQVDLPIGESHIGLVDLQPMSRQKPCGKTLPGDSKTPSGVLQMGSSDFSNSSTLTSRKVRTWT